MPLFQNLPTAAVQLQPDTKIMRVNGLAQSQFQLASILKENDNTLFCDLIDDSDKLGFFQFLNSPEKGARHYSTTITSSSKERFHITTNISTLDDGSHLMLLNKNKPTYHDCNNLDLQNKILEAQYQYNPGGILIVNNAMEMLSFNQEFIHMWEIPEAIQISRNETDNQHHMLSCTKKPDTFLDKISDLYTNPYKSSTDEIHLKNGRTFYRHTYPIFTNTEYLGRVWYFLDISDLHNTKEKLRFMAHHDTLTELPNRRLFHDLLKQCISKAQRNGKMVGVLFLDLDNFKAINDTFGHDIGDDLLKELAATLQSCLRDSDVICRWGGDEFVIALPDISSTNDAELVAKKLINTVKKNYSKGNFDKFDLGTSIGIAMFPEHSTRPDRLIRNADHAMYLAKRHGKNRHVHFSPNHFHQKSSQQETL